MVLNNKIKYIVLYIFFIIPSFLYAAAPHLTIIFVADQFAYHYIPRFESHFTGGLRTLLDYGVVYENAYYPHAMPATATGHAALNTGCFAKDHGFINNKWFDPISHQTIRCTHDSSPQAAIFAKNGRLKKGTGASAKNLMVEGISDQIVLQKRPGSTNKVFSISYKDRAAIATASDLGKAIWFDSTAGYFTSSKAYFDQLPTWLSDFNKQQKLNMPRKLLWKLRFPKKSGAYALKNSERYDLTTFKKTMINVPIVLPNQNDPKEPYELFIMTPHANKTLFDLALTCIDHNLSTNKNDKLVVWICLSSTDKLGHKYGPNSLEIQDMIYHLDLQMRSFMRQVEKRVKRNNILYGFTADHGVAPIPELANEKGIKSATRINEKALIKKANQFIFKKYGIKELIFGYRTPHFYFDKKLFSSLKTTKKNRIFADLKTFMRAQPGIKNAWSINELLNGCYTTNDIELLYKNQIFPGRSGDLAIQIHPFCMTTKHPTGTAHRTPYEHNTHVPIILYQKGTVEGRKVKERVSVLQFANSVAQILEVPNAPASRVTILPKLFE